MLQNPDNLIAPGLLVLYSYIFFQAGLLLSYVYKRRHKSNTISSFQFKAIHCCFHYYYYYPSRNMLFQTLKCKSSSQSFRQQSSEFFMQLLFISINRKQLSPLKVLSSKATVYQRSGFQTYHLGQTTIQSLSKIIQIIFINSAYLKKHFQICQTPQIHLYMHIISEYKQKTKKPKHIIHLKTKHSTFFISFNQKELNSRSNHQLVLYYVDD